MKKLASLMSVVVGSTLAFAGCAVDTADEPVVEASEAACSNTEGTNAMVALLANAMAAELGRWELLTDFEVFRGFNNQAMLRVKAGTTCANSCATVNALLGFQDSRLDQKFVFADGTKLSSWSYAARLTAGYDAQKACSQNKQCPYEQHKLTFQSTATGTCDLASTYGAQKPAGGNLTNTSQLSNALKWTNAAGTNPFINFSSTSTSVTIGNSRETNPGTASTVFSCTQVSPTSASPSLVGRSCSCPGNATPSTLKRETTNPTTPSILYCRR
jgi:hypothetical protein